MATGDTVVNWYVKFTISKSLFSLLPAFIFPQVELLFLSLDFFLTYFFQFSGVSVFF